MDPTLGHPALGPASWRRRSNSGRIIRFWARRLTMCGPAPRDAGTARRTLNPEWRGHDPHSQAQRKRSIHAPAPGRHAVFPEAIEAGPKACQSLPVHVRARIPIIGGCVPTARRHEILRRRRVPVRRLVPVPGRVPTKKRLAGYCGVRLSSLQSFAMLGEARHQHHATQTGPSYICSDECSGL